MPPVLIQCILLYVDSQKKMHQNAFSVSYTIIKLYQSFEPADADASADLTLSQTFIQNGENAAPTAMPTATLNISI